jgi:DNA-binding protein HU-beta
MNSVLIDNLVSLVGTKKLAEKVFKAFLADIAKTLADGGQVTLPGVGKLSVKKRAARNGRNVATGESIQIPEKNAVAFKVAKQLKDAVNGGAK